MKTAFWRTLVGFLPEADLAQCPGRSDLGFGEAYWNLLDQKIQAARWYVDAMCQRMPVNVERGALPASCRPYLRTLQQEPRFSDFIEGKSAYRFGWVGLENLAVYRRRVNSKFIADIQTHVARLTDLDSLLRFCLPLHHELRDFHLEEHFNETDNRLAITQSHTDLRTIYSAGDLHQRSKTSWLPSLLDQGASLISVVRYEERYFLLSGYHRAMALARNGQWTVPALIMNVECYEQTGIDGPGIFGPEIMLGSKPPLFTDFFSPAAVEIPHRRTRLHITLRAEVEAVAV